MNLTQKMDVMKSQKFRTKQLQRNLEVMKELSLLNTVLNQKKLKWFEDAKQGKYKMLGDVEKVKTEAEKASGINEKLLNLTKRLQDKFPDIAKELSKVESILSSTV